MKVTIIVGGKFHAFNLAEQLEKNNYLNNLITSYPIWKIINRYKIKKKKIKSFFLKEIIERLLILLKLEKYLNYFQFYLNLYFEYFATKKVDFKNIKILVGWSGFSLSSFKKSKNYIIVKILERGSSHIEYQKNILIEEYKKFNLNYLFDQKLVDKEVQEYELADYIFVPSEFVKRTFIEKGFKKNKIIKIPYGVDLNKFYPKKKTDNIFRYIYVGTLSIRKGILYILEAFSELNLPNTELLLIGHINDEIKPLIEKYKRNKKIKFLGHIDQDYLVNFYNKSDVFVISSIEDGFAMVILQALACGLPVICSENSGGSELIKNGKNGYVVPIRNIKYLKFRMYQIYKNKKKREQIKNLIIRNRKSFSWDTYGKRILTKYKSFI